MPYNPESNHKYNISAKGKARNKRYEHSYKGKQTRKLWRKKKNNKSRSRTKIDNLFRLAGF